MHSNEGQDYNLSTGLFQQLLFIQGGDRDSGAREKGLYPEPLGTAGRGLGLFPEKEPRIRCREGASLGQQKGCQPRKHRLLTQGHLESGMGDLRPTPCDSNDDSVDCHKLGGSVGTQKRSLGQCGSPRRLTDLKRAE